MIVVATYDDLSANNSSADRLIRPRVAQSAGAES